MGFSDLKRSRSNSEADALIQEEKRQENFRMRIAAQQFLKHNGPLMKVFVRMGGDPDQIAQRGVFEQKCRFARSLAVEITARVLNKAPEDVSMQEARHFRLEASEIVAQAWEEGRDIDIKATADQVASAVAGADDAYDGETIQWSRVSGFGSASLTAASVSMALSRVVMIYDFRHGQDVVLSMLTSSVVEATREAVNVIAPDMATPEDRRSLSQTTLQAFSGIMAQIYEEAAKEALRQLVDLPLERRKAWLRARAPLESIISRFRTWTSEIADIASETAKATLIASREQVESIPQNQ